MDITIISQVNGYDPIMLTYLGKNYGQVISFPTSTTSVKGGGHLVVRIEQKRGVWT